MAFKVCTICKTEKTLDRFSNHRRMRDGKQSSCRDCNNLRTSKKRRENPEEYKKRDRDRYRKNPRARKGYALKAQYGISLDDYERMLSDQGGVCDMCGKAEVVTRNGVIKRLSVDHCHETGMVRGLICQSCNMVMRPDDIDFLKMRIDYLRRHQDKRNHPYSPAAPSAYALSLRN